MLEPMLPLINVVFLLLIFFMVAGNLAPKPRLNLDTPKSTTAQKPLLEMPHLALRANGQLLLNGEPISTRLLARKGQTLLSTKRPRLHADGRVTTGELRPVLQALRKAGFEAVRVITVRRQS